MVVKETYEEPVLDIDISVSEHRNGTESINNGDIVERLEKNSQNDEESDESEAVDLSRYLPFLYNVLFLSLQLRGRTIMDSRIIKVIRPPKTHEKSKIIGHLWGKNLTKL